MKKSFIPLVMCALGLVCGCKSNEGQGTGVSGGKDGGSDTKGFTVVSVVPEGELSSKVSFPSIQVQFSEPVVALAKLGEPSAKSSVVSIEPELKGVFRWYGTSILSFDCSDALIPQKEYKIKINPSLKSISGASIEGKLEYSFHTEEMRITGLRPGYLEQKKQNRFISLDDVPVEYARNVAVYFANEVKAAVVAQSLVVRGAGGKEYNFTAKQAEPKVVLLEFKEDFAKNTDITVVLKKGAVPDKGCWATESEQSEKFHTLRPFVSTDISGTSTLVLSFNHGIKAGLEKQIYEALSFSPKMEITPEQVSVYGGSVYVSDLPVDYGDSYTFTLNGGVVTDVYGQTFNEILSKKIRVGDAYSYISYRDRNIEILESSYKPQRSFEHQNVEKGASYTVTPISGVTEGFKLPAGKTVDVTLSKENKNRRVIQTVDLSPYLESVGGQYRGAVVFTCRTPYKSGHKIEISERKSVIQVTDLGVSCHSSWNESAFMVTRLSDGKAVKGAKVQVVFAGAASKTQPDIFTDVLSGKGQVLATGTTDETGLAVLRFDMSSEMRKSGSYYGNQINYIVSTEDDRVAGNISNYSGIDYKAADLDGDNKDVTVPNYRAIVHVFSDRGLYRPGETASFKIIDRTLSLGKYSTYVGGYKIKFVTYGRKGKVEYETLTGTTSAEGTASAVWTLPEDLEPGTYRLEYERTGSLTGSGSCSINVQFFERLRFQASAEITPVQYFAGDNITALVSASYLGGGSLSGASVHSDWTRYKSSFVPAGQESGGYTFGPSDDWYWSNPVRKYDYDVDEAYEDNEVYYHFQEDTAMGPDGTARLSAKTGEGQKEGYPYSYNLESQVTDAGNQVIAARASTIVHPAAFYLGLSGIKNIKGFAKTGEKLEFDIIPLTPDGLYPDASSFAKNQKIEWSVAHKTWEEVKVINEYGIEESSWQEKLEEVASGNVAVPAKGKTASLSMQMKEGGRYQLTVRCADSKGRAVITQRSFYVTGSQKYSRNDESNSIELTCDKTLYSVGDTANVMLSSTLPVGNYLVTVEREGILSEEVISLDSPSTVIPVKIKESYVPIVWVSVSSYSLRTAEPPADYDTAAEGKISAVHGSTEIYISTESHFINVQIENDKNCYKPGEKAEIKLTAKKSGKPVKDAELTLLVVDRGVLDLIGYNISSPLNNFYGEWLFNSMSYCKDSRTYLVDPVTYGTYTLPAKEEMVLLSKDKVLMKSAGAVMNEASSRASAVYYDMEVLEEAKAFDESAELESAAEEGGSLQVRKDFRATALFLPDLKTDSNGVAKAEFKLPDSLTEYVVTVVAVKENDFGKNTAPLVTANPLSVRDVETRILRPGDNGEAGVVLTNIGDTDEKVQVEFDVLSGLEKTGYVAAKDSVARLSGKANVSGEGKKTVVVKAGETKTLMFRVDAVESGWITLAFRVKSDSLNEVVYKPLEIEKTYIYETVTTVGQIDADESSAQEKIIFPSGTEDGRGSFTVQLDSSRLGTLKSAVDYVFRYPYGCLEQRSSAVLPLVAFGEYIGVFGLQSEVSDAAAVAMSEIKTWASLQRKDGGFPYWPDGNVSSLAVSLRIAEVLSVAKAHDKNFVSGIDTAKLVSYIQSELKKAEKEHWAVYSKAYCYYVLSLYGKKISDSDLRALIDDKDRSGVSEIAFAGLVAFNQGNRKLAEEAALKIKNMMALTVRGCSFQLESPWYFWNFCNGESERFALTLHLFMLLDKSDVYVEHLVWQLLENQRAGNGYWKNTATTGRVLITLDAYIREMNLAETDFTAEALLDGKSLLKNHFEGTAAKPVEQTYSFGKDFPAEFDKEVPLTVTKDGTGTLFYTASMSYALTAEEQKARDEGLCVYVEITDARTGEKVEGSELKSGVIYRQKVYVTTCKNRNFVAVRAPVPAGAEILNGAFATTVSVPTEKKTEETYRWWWREPMSHQDVYDAEVRCFWDYMPIGNYNFEFLFRAQRDGTYQTPGVLAECMYESEVFGRSAGKVWKID